MAKKGKDFTGGIDNLINPPQSQQEESNIVEQKKPIEKVVRANFVMSQKYHKNLKLIAVKESVDIKDSLAEALDDFFIKKAHLLD